VAQSFRMHNKDLLYVADAPAAELQKLAETDRQLPETIAPSLRRPFGAPLGSNLADVAE
jgi:hypothetical protein